VFTDGNYNPAASATVVLIGINCLLFLATHDVTLIGGASLERDSLVAWATYGFPIDELGEWWRLVSGAFLHADVRHLLLNMIMLFLLGRRLERQIGWVPFIAVCTTSMFWGSAGALVAAPNTAVVGASGMVYGIMAAVLIVERSSGKDPWSEGLGTLIIVNIVLSFVIPGISVGGHLGGLIGGLLCGWAAGDQRQRSLSRMWTRFSPLALAGFVMGLLAAKTWLNPLI
jgi:membrane associated rhomboid family serine protease